MTSTPQLSAMMQAANASEKQASEIIAGLEQAGFAVYKKKVQKNQRRPKSSHTMTDELAQHIRDFYFNNPATTQQQIANIFKVNIGRVNEALSERAQ